MWWSTWPNALVGIPTGKPIGAVVLDIDCKSDRANGYDTLEDLGHAVLSDTPMSHTVSGGLHVYFAYPECELKCSAGLIGPGLDVRSDGGYAIAPSPGSGYTWDPIWNFRTVALAPAPDWLWPAVPSRPPLPAGEKIKPVIGLDRYGEAAISKACQAIAEAGPGQQEKTLNAESFSIGTLAGAGAVPADIAVRALLRAAHTMPDYDARFPWRPEEIENKVRRAFEHGLSRPREARPGGLAA